MSESGQFPENGLEAPDNSSGEEANPAPGMMQILPADMPRRWNGPRSDVSFDSRFEGGKWILGIRIEAEIPVVVRDLYDDPEYLDAHADMMDFCLAVARDGEKYGDEEIAQNALSLLYCRDFYRSTGKRLLHDIEDHRSRIEVSSESLRALERNRVSAEALCRISDRIEGHLTRVVGEGFVKAMETQSKPASLH